MFFELTTNIINQPIQLPEPYKSGRSRDGRQLDAFKFGNGPFYISLLAGCHADEPTGPRFLRKLITFLSKLSGGHPLLKKICWYIVPHANPDGEARNKAWYDDKDTIYDLALYLQHVARELPGDDMEYGFPIENQIGSLRPENQFIYDFWRSADHSFSLHASLHGMGMSFGPWFLIESDWQNRSAFLQKHCQQKVLSMNYSLFDWDRKGEKGFFKISEGFSTRPDSGSMKAFFLERNNPVMASKFHPSSMESIRSLSHDCLTLVSEMPLFLIPKAAGHFTETAALFTKWKELFKSWKKQLIKGDDNKDEFNTLFAQNGIHPMPVQDQMILQWHFICAGIKQVMLNNQ
jgi:hypothetical protein